MAALSAAPHITPSAGRWSDPRRVSVVRAILAFVWAAAFVIAVRHRVPSTNSDLRFAAAILLTTYPAIDVIASVVAASSSALSAARLLRLNGLISSTAVVALAVTTLGSDVGSVLIAFGTWAVISGVLQVVVAVRRRVTDGRQLPILVSGGVSALAGISFAAASRNDTAHLTNLAGYMTFGAVLFLLSAFRGRRLSDAPES